MTLPFTVTAGAAGLGNSTENGMPSLSLQLNIEIPISALVNALLTFASSREDEEHAGSASCGSESSSENSSLSSEIIASRSSAAAAASNDRSRALATLARPALEDVLQHATETECLMPPIATDGVKGTLDWSKGTWIKIPSNRADTGFQRMKENKLIMYHNIREDFQTLDEPSTQTWQDWRTLRDTSGVFYQKSSGRIVRSASQVPAHVTWTRISYEFWDVKTRQETAVRPFLFHDQSVDWYLVYRGNERYLWNISTNERSLHVPDSIPGWLHKGRN